eukprot:4558626-Amphidinium_carterae.1
MISGPSLPNKPRIVDDFATAVWSAVGIAPSFCSQSHHSGSVKAVFSRGPESPRITQSTE